MNLTKNTAYFVSTKATLKRWGWYLLIAIVLWFIMVFINHGHIPPLRSEMATEVIFAFVFLESLYWAHLLIINELLPKLKRLPTLLGNFLELLVVWIAGHICGTLFNLVPILIIFGTSVLTSQDGLNLRAAIAISPIISVIFYYFIERAKMYDRLQQENLRISKLEKENYQAQLQALKNQMSPHFLFNNLNVLASIIPYDTEKALEYTHRLSDLYRYYLRSAQEDLISLTEELKFIEAYRFLLQTRFGDQLNINLSISDNQKDEWYLPPGVIQECMENAVKHNGTTKDKTLFITIEKQGNKICITNAKQLKRMAEQTTKTGWENIIKRYQLMGSELPSITETEGEYKVFLPLLQQNKS